MGQNGSQFDAALESGEEEYQAATATAEDQAYSPKDSDPFVWTGARLRAVALVAEDHLTNKKICEKLGIGKGTLIRWKAHPDFSAAVQLQIKRIGTEQMRRGVARPDKRMQRMDEDWQGLLAIRDARKKDYAENRTWYEDNEALTPGAETGLMDLKTTLLGKGENATLHRRFHVDAVYLSGIASIEDRAARAAGQEVARVQLLDADGNSVGGGIGAARRDPIGYMVGAFRDFLEEYCDVHGIPKAPPPFEATGAAPGEEELLASMGGAVAVEAAP